MPSKSDFMVQRGYEVIADHLSGFAVPRGSPEDLKRYHMAAHKAFYCRFSSIDYVLKTYGSSWDFSRDHPEVYGLLFEGTSKIRVNVDAIVRKGHGLIDLPNHLGLVMAQSALQRAQSSFKAACLLCEAEMGFEVFCVAKLILEQIAWAYAIHKIDDNSLYRVKPCACISHLKSLFPNVGRMYGYMNEQSHMDPKVIHGFLKVEDENFIVVLRDVNKCLLGCLGLLYLADMYGTCTEIVYGPWCKEFVFITKKKSGIKLKPHRKSQTEIEDFDTRVFDYLQRTTDKTTKDPTSQGP